MEEVLKIINPMTSTVFWSIIVFILLIIILWRFVLKPVNKIISKRQTEIRDNIDGAEKKKEEAHKYIEEQKRLLEDAKMVSRRIIEEGKINAMKTRQEIEEKAGERSRLLLESTMQEIEAEKNKSVEAVKNQIVDIAVELSEKIVSKSLSAEEHEKIIEESLNDIYKMK
jgi:F-type H+-transporting ATPase subunit b